jgi:squalene-hopene/tetraprenyl-beta-curcumene cyclase
MTSSIVSTPTTVSSRSGTSVSDALLAARARVVQTLLDRRTPAGYWEGHLSSSALATATAVTALAVARSRGVAPHDAQRLVDNGVAWLVATRNDDGGWGDSPESISNISTTALVWAALSFGDSAATRGASESAATWIRRAAGSVEPARLAEALAARYGKDRTFSVPILTMCAIAERLGPADQAWRLIPPLPFELSTFPRGLFGALRLPVVSYALPALISMGIARHRRAPSIPLVSSLRERAAARALRVLDGLQPSNGGFLEATPLTAFVTMSLLAAGEERHPCVERALDFLRRSVRDDGSWPIDTNLATWTTTLAVNALARYGSLPLDGSERESIVAFLLRQQWTGVHPYTGAAPGGWAWTDLPGGVPDADDTAGAVLALSHLAPDRADVKKAAVDGISWLLDLQNSDGGIPTFCRGWGTLPFDRSSTDLTAHALRAWTAWSGRLTGDAVVTRIARATGKAVEFLARAQRVDGAFVPLWFGNQQAPEEENPIFGTARVVKGLLAVARQPRAREVAARARGYLLRAQGPSGGWGGAPGVAPSIEETAVTVAALSGFVNDRETDAVRERGLEWLRHATVDFSQFPTAPIGLYFARLWYTEELYPLLLTADACAVT